MAKNSSKTLAAVFPQDDPDGLKAAAELEKTFGSAEACYVGLDLSLASTGFCLKRGEILEAVTIKTDPKTCPNDLARLRHISDKIMGKIPKGTKMICIEDFFTPANPFQIGAAISLAMLGATVRMALYEAGFPMFIVHASQLKKFATGKGSGQKSIVVREVFRQWGLEAKDDNQADACALCYMAKALCEPTEGLPKYQQDVVKTVSKDRPRYNVSEPLKIG